MKFYKCNAGGRCEFCNGLGECQTAIGGIKVCPFCEGGKPVTIVDALSDLCERYEPPTARELAQVLLAHFTNAGIGKG